MSSSVKPETHTLDLSALTEQVAEEEEQAIEVIPTAEDYVSDYKLSVGGVYTGSVVVRGMIRWYSRNCFKLYFTKNQHYGISFNSNYKLPILIRDLAVNQC